MPLQALSISSQPYENSNWSYSPKNARFGANNVLTSLTLTFDFRMDIIFVNGDMSLADKQKEKRLYL